MQAQGGEPVDVVYTWVDDSFPGYLDELNRYAADPRDTDPARTRDNLQTLRYSLRSLERNMPWVRNVYLFTCRPQVPPWLNLEHPKLRVVHHDAVMAPGYLPTFNSFAIVSHLHLLPGLSRRFLYIVDDMLVLSPAIRDALFAPDGRPWVYLEGRETTPLDRLDPATDSAWNLALGQADAALAARFGPRARPHIAHAPQLLDREVFAEALAAFPELVEATRAARFRAAGNVPPEYLVAHYMLDTGHGLRPPPAAERRMQGYVSLYRAPFYTRARLALVALRRPLSVTLNDNLDEQARDRIEAQVRRWMRRRFPAPSAFELGG